jgi:excisionase family DNA binding protein
MQEDRWLTVTQVAQELQVHEETVRRWLRQGRLEGHNFSGRTGYRIRRSELDAFMNAEIQNAKCAA